MAATVFRGTVGGLRTVPAGVRVTINEVGARYGDSGTLTWSYTHATGPALGAAVTVTIDGGGGPTFTATVTGLDVADEGLVDVMCDVMRYRCALADAPALGDSVPVTVA